MTPAGVRAGLADVRNNPTYVSTGYIRYNLQYIGSSDPVVPGAAYSNLKS